MNANPPAGYTGGRAADRYTLPAGMGGHECEIVWQSDALVPGTHIAKVRYTIDGFEVNAEVLASWLTPVKPPLPPEPSQGAIRIDHQGVVWQRNGGTGSRTPWYAARDLADLDWTSLNEQRGPLRTVVPDPFGEPVQLPWVHVRFDNGERVERVEVSEPVFYDQGRYIVCVGLEGRWHRADFTPAKARDFARAVWAAANQAERNQT